MLFFVGIVIFLGLLFLGVPIWLTLSVAGAFWILVQIGLPINVLPTQIFVATDSWVLLAIPYFLLAGNLMIYLGLAEKIVQLVRDLAGHFRGGLPAAGVLACAMFSALSGSSIATAIAIGSLIVPKMIEMGYSKENSLGLMAASGTLGVMIPPSIIFIIYASLAQVSVADLFLAGIIPGILVSILLVITAVFVSNRDVGSTYQTTRSSFKQIVKSFLEAIPALLMPLIILGGIFTGFFTPTESAAIAVVYVLLIGYIFNRKDFTFTNFTKSVKRSVGTTAVIYILLGGTQLFATAMSYTQVPQRITEFVVSTSLDPWAIMLMIGLLLIILGTILDPTPIMLITMPILYPVVIDLGFDPIHFGVVNCLLMMIAQITPPVGGTLFALSGYFRESILVVAKGSIPYLFALIIALLILLFFPWFSLVLIS